MFNALTKEAREALLKANEAALSFNHDYVGTEHVLLGVIEGSSKSVASILATFGVTAENVRAEIEKLVQRGAEPIVRQTVPFTPRAEHAISQAEIGATYFDQACAGPEHLLLGLMHVEHGLAHQVLRNLGVQPRELLAEVFRSRMTLMKTIEQAVRPLRASTPKKRKIREELFAHLSAIYDDELERAGKPNVALEAAIKRFGEPKDLVRELQSALPFHERLSYFIERWFAWRAPESLVRYAFRQARLTFCVLAVVLPLVVVGIYLAYGEIEPARTLARLFASVVFIVPPAQFAVTVLCFKVRDAMWGVFGSRKSLGNALMYDGLIAVVVAAACLGFAWAAQPAIRNVWQAVLPSLISGSVAALGYMLTARFFGPATIRDTIWAMLKIENASPEKEAA